MDSSFDPQSSAGKLLNALVAASGRDLQWDQDGRCDLKLGEMPFCIQVLQEEEEIIVLNAMLGKVENALASEALGWNFSWRMVRDNALAWDAMTGALHLIRFRRIADCESSAFPGEVLDFLECAAELTKLITSRQSGIGESAEIQSVVTGGA